MYCFEWWNILVFALSTNNGARLATASWKRGICSFRSALVRVPLSYPLYMNMCGVEYPLPFLTLFQQLRWSTPYSAHWQHGFASLKTSHLSLTHRLVFLMVIISQSFITQKILYKALLTLSSLNFLYVRARLCLQTYQALFLFVALKHFFIMCFLSFAGPSNQKAYIKTRR